MHESTADARATGQAWALGATPCFSGLRYSPGWTRTNNPPVNSRMLCQLSYRGSLGRESLAKLAFHLLERVPDPGEDALQFDRPGQVLSG